MSAQPISARDYARIVNKQQRLPSMLERARRRVRQIEAECIMYGMKDLLTNPTHANRAFEREVAAAKAMNTEGGE